MRFVHETHRVVGERAEAFEAAYRERYMPALAEDGDARLLWYLNQAHGTGRSYTVVTLTACGDGPASDRYVRRLEEGDLSRWRSDVDRMRHEVTAKVLQPVEWSAMQDVALDGVPVDGAEREPVVYMEDTVWPFPGALEGYLAAAGTLYARETIGKRLAQGTSLLELRACFLTRTGEHAGREVVLWQRVVRPELLLPLVTREIPAEHRGPGTWMREALAYRDRWESRLLRTAAWSPLD